MEGRQYDGKQNVLPGGMCRNMSDHEPTRTMTDYISITDEHGVQVEIHPGDGEFEVYVGSSHVGTMSGGQVFACADNEEIVVPDSIVV